MKFKLLILDFDDTLFPTTEYNNNNQTLLPNDVFTIDSNACKLISTYLSRDFKIVIITNSQLGWFKLISDNFLPNLKNLLSLHSISVISANDLYSCIYPSDFIKWKICAYEDFLLQNLLIDSSKGCVETNIKYKDVYILSMGDSHVDRIATSFLNKGNCSKLCKIQTKFIQYQEHPNISCLINQSNFVINSCDLLDNLTNSTTFYVDVPYPIYNTTPPIVETNFMNNTNMTKDDTEINNNNISGDTIFEFSDLPDTNHPTKQYMNDNIYQEIFFTKPNSPEPYF